LRQQLGLGIFLRVLLPFLDGGFIEKIDDVAFVDDVWILFGDDAFRINRAERWAIFRSGIFIPLSCGMNFSSRYASGYFLNLSAQTSQHILIWTPSYSTIGLSALTSSSVMIGQRVWSSTVFLS
jgi:hypothetical protein